MHGSGDDRKNDYYRAYRVDHGRMAVGIAARCAYSRGKGAGTPLGKHGGVVIPH